jgi:hypothetical protein
MNPDFQVYAKILKFVKTSIHVFDHTIKSILLYGCEIWGYFNPLTSRFRNRNIPIDQFFSKQEPELLNHIPKYLQRDTHSKLLF